MRIKEPIDVRRMYFEDQRNSSRAFQCDLRNACDCKIVFVEEAVGRSAKGLIFVSSLIELEDWTRMRIEKADDAGSVVRKYFLGTRTSHGKIASLSTEQETEGPDEKGAWKVKGTYVTEAGMKEEFTAIVTPRGEVLITSSTKAKTHLH